MGYEVNSKPHEAHHKIARQFGLKVGRKQPELMSCLTDVFISLKYLKSRGYMNACKIPLSEIESWINTFSTYDGTAKDFIHLFIIAENIVDKKNE